MKRALFGTVLCAVLCTLGPSAHAGGMYFQVSNLTLSGGGSAYPVASDLAFKGLALKAQFADGSETMVPLNDAQGAAQTSLDTAGIVLQSVLIALPDNIHGAVKQVTLTGTLSDTHLNVQTTFAGPVVAVMANPSISVTLPAPAANAVAPINAVDASGKTYAIGTLSVFPAPSVVTAPYDRGDVNGDGMITIQDAVLALKVVIGLSDQIAPAQLDAADYTGDGTVDIADVRMILQRVVGF